MGDVRVPVSPLLAAFGLAVTVTRPAPDNTPIATTGVWFNDAFEQEPRPYGTDFQRREPRRLMAIPRSAVATMPRGTTVAAPEIQGGTSKTWRVDGLDTVDADFWRVVLILVS